MEGKLNEGFRGTILDKWRYGVVSGGVDRLTS